MPTNPAIILSLLLGGLLIGLGGPFWYDAVNGLSQLLKFTRGQPAAPPPAPVTVVVAPPPAPPPAEAPEDRRKSGAEVPVEPAPPPPPVVVAPVVAPPPLVPMRALAAFAAADAARDATPK